jgi:hypothetical protein
VIVDDDGGHLSTPDQRLEMLRTYLPEVKTLYQEAHLDLDAELSTLTDGRSRTAERMTSGAPSAAPRGFRRPHSAFPSATGARA